MLVTEVTDKKTRVKVIEPSLTANISGSVTVKERYGQDNSMYTKESCVYQGALLTEFLSRGQTCCIEVFEWKEVWHNKSQNRRCQYPSQAGTKTREGWDQ